MTANLLPPDLLTCFQTLHKLELTLSAEREPQALLARAMDGALRMIHADCGKLYLKTNDTLRCMIVRILSRNLRQGGPGEEPVAPETILLYDTTGRPNEQEAYVRLLENKTALIIEDIAHHPTLRFESIAVYERKFGYHSHSLLALPLLSAEGLCIGVLALLNAQTPQHAQPTAFSLQDLCIAEFIASQAAIAYGRLQLLQSQAKLLDSAKQLNEIGIALSVEKDSKRLLELILEAAKSLTHADGGTLYIKEGDALKFEIMLSTSLHIRKGGTSGVEIPFAPLPLRDAQGRENRHMVAVHTACTKETVNIPDAYTNQSFSFSGTRAFDMQTGYRSQSFLTVPLTDYNNELLGVLQLINATDEKTGTIQPFTAQQQELVESLASQAAVALVNRRLIEEQRELFNAFIQLIAGAIDEKSPYTGGHCQRVPELTMMIAEAVAQTSHGPEEIRTFQMSDEDRYELKVAALLHDCGKITTRESVVDKATKLETIFDRIALIETRFEVLKRDIEIRLLRQQLAHPESALEPSALAARLAEQVTMLEEEKAFLAKCNIGGESMSDERMARVDTIARRRWVGPNGQEQALLTDDEVENLKIFRGTLTAQEREHINHHIVATIRMLEALPYPSYLRNVARYAGGHHERMDGRGYPNGLTREQMPLQARMMGIADIFEALTAGDRPYKKAMSLSTALSILGNMKLDNHIDPDLFDVFIREKIYQQYAERFLKPEQMDVVDITQLPGYHEATP